MIKSSVEKMSRDIGFDIGHSDDEVQANLLDGFCDALNQLCNRDKETQICYIVDKLKASSYKTLLEFGEFIKIKGENK